MVFGRMSSFASARSAVGTGIWQRHLKAQICCGLCSSEKSSSASSDLLWPGVLAVVKSSGLSDPTALQFA